MRSFPQKQHHIPRHPGKTYKIISAHIQTDALLLVILQWVLIDHHAAPLIIRIYYFTAANAVQIVTNVSHFISSDIRRRLSLGCGLYCWCCIFHWHSAQLPYNLCGLWRWSCFWSKSHQNQLPQVMVCDWPSILSSLWCIQCIWSWWRCKNKFNNM